MKQIFAIRHAKSSWEIAGQSDFDRALNDRGQRDAPMMAERLYQKGFKPDAIISSPAVRAFATAQYFAGQFGFKKKDIVKVERLYHAAVETFYDVISKELSDTWKNVMLFSHNPGITYFANSTGVVKLDNMPTCGILGMEADIESWQQFRDAKKRFILFDYPKNNA